MRPISDEAHQDEHRLAHVSADVFFVVGLGRAVHGRRDGQNLLVLLGREVPGLEKLHQVLLRVGLRPFIVYLRLHSASAFASPEERYPAAPLRSGPPSNSLRTEDPGRSGLWPTAPGDGSSFHLLCL